MTPQGGLGSRAAALDRLSESTRTPLDVLVIGGGITGAGCALDAASRGLRVGLVERFDFAWGTSSRSSKLVHGGLRYLEQRDFGLVREASVERRLLGRLAPHLVEPLPFVVPVDGRWPRARFGVGMWAYDALSSFRNAALHRYVDRAEVEAAVPCLRGCRGQIGNLRGGYVYYDSVTDDARLVVEVLVQAVRLGAVVANYAAVRGLKGDESGCRALVENTVDEDLFEVGARRVIVAAGVWNDHIESLGRDPAATRLRPSKGVHLVVRREDVRLEKAAAFIPDADRKRMLLIVPWHDVVVVGTTDTDFWGDLDRPRVTEEDKTYLLDALNGALGTELTGDDVIGSWAGLRPLIRSGPSATVDLSRAHAIYDMAPGVIGITGGKLTTYRRMAEDAVDHLAPSLDAVGRSRSRRIKLGCGDVGALRAAVQARAWSLGVPAGSLPGLVRAYGDRALEVLDVAAETGATQTLVPGRRPLAAEAIYGARAEMTVTLDDLLARRTRLALTDERAGLDGGSALELLGSELGWSTSEAKRQLAAYRGELVFERSAPLPQAVTV